MEITREERKELWERVLETSKPLNVVFIGSNDLLSDNPRGIIFVEVNKIPGRRFTEELRESYFLLRNFNKDEEIYEVDVFHCEVDEFEDDLKEHIDEINEAKEYGLSGIEDMFYIKIVEDNRFIWNYINRK